ncbi:uncharacterized protein [Typha latifolia]|uniref:uncharacterized protein n=1 Tax=Typha latifolia TaxID=4733 RepID=UPI003C2FFA51
MAKRELSSNIRNMKFMQRAALVHKAEKPKEEEENEKIKPDAEFHAPALPVRKCIVIMEGNPQPEALKGRMSFQSFNPSIDKINDEAASINQMQTSPSSTRDQNSLSCNRVDSSGDSKDANTENDSPSDLKRKQPEREADKASPKKLLKSIGGDYDGQSSFQNNRRGHHKSEKREKLDWNALRRPKTTNKS